MEPGRETCKSKFGMKIQMHKTPGKTKNRLQYKQTMRCPFKRVSTSVETRGLIGRIHKTYSKCSIGLLQGFTWLFIHKNKQLRASKGSILSKRLCIRFWAIAWAMTRLFTCRTNTWPFPRLEIAIFYGLMSEAFLVTCPLKWGTYGSFLRALHFIECFSMEFGTFCSGRS